MKDNADRKSAAKERVINPVSLVLACQNSKMSFLQVMTHDHIELLKEMQIHKELDIIRETEEMLIWAQNI